MALYKIPANLATVLQSAAGREALGIMFEERLRALTNDLAKAENPDDLLRLQGSIREVKAFQSSLAT